MPDKSKIRTPEQKLRKMLREENTILNLELAIKKELFRKAQNTELGFHEMHIEDNGRQMTLVSVHETNGKISNILNSVLNKIGF